MANLKQVQLQLPFLDGQTQFLMLNEIPQTLVNYQIPAEPTNC